MSIESGGYFGSNSAIEQPRHIQRYSLDRCDPVMDVEDDGEWCRWDEVQPFVECEPCEGCNLAPISCQGLTLKQACEKISKLKAALQPFANYACDPPCGCHNCIAKAALEI